ncbi:gag-pol fusion protein [Saccharomyces cerevisiae]|nr:gag-pol fusion protein [Saccharomyces cerevisiae]
MESQQLSQHSPISHGSACASVTSKEVQTTQDPLDISASKTEECEKVSTQANSQQPTTPPSSAVPENHHHASPQAAQVPLPQNGPYPQQRMMNTQQANISGWPVYGHPSLMPYPPYQMSPMYAPPGAQSQFTQYPQYVGTHLNTPSPESGNSFPDSSSAKSNMTSTNQHVRPPPILTSPNDFLNWVKIYIKFLQNSNLGDIIPTATRKAVRQMTDDELTFLCHTFQLFAPSQFLPPWVKDILSVDYTDIMKILSKSINKMQSDTQEVNDITTLATLHYNGSTPADAFEAEVTNILDRLNNNGIPINNKVACQFIMRGLSGESAHHIHSASSNPDINVVDAQKRNIPINAIGDLQFHFQDNTKTSIKVLHTPNIAYDLLSLNELAAVDITACFTKNVLERSDGTVLAPIVKYGDFYWVSKKYLLPSNISVPTINNVHTSESTRKYPYPFIHRMLAHANAQTIRYSLKNNTITYFNESDVDWSSAIDYQCPDCLIGKSTKHRHIKGSRLKYQNSYEPFQYLHTDIFGPVHNLPKSAPSYFISFTDETTKFRWVYPVHDRREDSILDVFTTILAFIKNQFQASVLVIQMDRGSEYTNRTLHKFLEKNGITPCYTTTADSRAHGVAERLNRTLLDDCRTQLQCSGLPNHLWFSAIEFSTIVRNSLASPKSKKSARQHAGLAGLDISTLLPFGQPVIVNDHNPNSKIHPRGIPGYALHPSRNSYGYIIYLPSLKKTVDTTNYVILQGKESRLDQFNYDALTFDEDLNRLTASYQSFIASNEIQQSNDLNIESDHDFQSDIELYPEQPRNVLSKAVSPTDSTPPSTHTEDSKRVSKTNIRAPREVDPNISESNILPSKKRSSTPQISDIESTDSGGMHRLDVPLLAPMSQSNTHESSYASKSKDFRHSDSYSDNETNHTNVPISSTGGTNNKTVPQTSEQETEKRIIHRSPSIDTSSSESNSLHHVVPIKTSDTCPKENTEESIIADLPLPDLPPEPPTELSDSFKELPPINSRQTNSSLGGIGDSNAYTTINSKKRSLEDNETEIKVSRDTWNTKNMRSLEPPRSKKRIHLIAAVKAVKSIKPIRTTLRYDEAITYNKDIKEKEKYIEAYHKEVNQLLKMKTWDTDKYYDRKEIDPKRVINSMFIFNRKRDGTHKARFVARGDIQHPDTYDSGMQSNTVHHYALMTSLSLALDNNYYITQLDISSAYLYADIKEELYIRPPPHLGMNDKLIRLKKSLYGLKQSGANWYETIKSYLIKQCDQQELELEEDDYKMKVHEMQKLIGLASYVGYKFRFDYYTTSTHLHNIYYFRPSKC